MTLEQKFALSRGKRDAREVRLWLVMHECEKLMTIIPRLKGKDIYTLRFGSGYHKDPYYTRLNEMSLGDWPHEEHVMYKRLLDWLRAESGMIKNKRLAITDKDLEAIKMKCVDCGITFWIAIEPDGYAKVIGYCPACSSEKIRTFPKGYIGGIDYGCIKAKVVPVSTEIK